MASKNSNLLPLPSTPLTASRLALQRFLARTIWCTSPNAVLEDEDVIKLGLDLDPRPYTAAAEFVPFEGIVAAEEGGKAGPGIGKEEATVKGEGEGKGMRKKKGRGKKSEKGDDGCVAGMLGLSVGEDIAVVLQSEVMNDWWLAFKCDIEENRNVVGWVPSAYLEVAEGQEGEMNMQFVMRGSSYAAGY